MVVCSVAVVIWRRGLLRADDAANSTRRLQVCRVYIGSFNGVKPIREDINPQCKPLFEKEQADLLADLHEIPVRSCDRKVQRSREGLTSGK